MQASMPSEVRAVYESWPLAPRARLMDVRARVFAVADALAVRPLSETLKWGQPSYLTAATRSGTTLRLWWSARAPQVCFVLFNCQSRLGDMMRERFCDRLDLEGARGIRLSVAGDLPCPESLEAAIGLVLTYHRQKREARLG